MGCNANKKNMGSKKNLRISKWAVNYYFFESLGCKLLEIMADGLYDVFHRFEAFLKKG